MELIDVHIGSYGRFELSVVFFFSFFFYFAPVRERKLIMARYDIICACFAVADLLEVVTITNCIH